MNNRRISVLVVEDEFLIRLSIVEELTDAGYVVFEASNSNEAIDVLVSNSSIEVIFTDINMPRGVDGLKLAASVRDRWPPIKILVTSGRHKVDIGSLPVDARFVAKPYEPMAVIQSIQKMIVN